MDTLRYTARHIDDDFTRRMARIFRMVVELHKIGYQGLRIYPQTHHDRFHLLPSLFITHPGSFGIVADWNFLTGINKFQSVTNQELTTVYYPFGAQIQGKNARELADDFIRRYPLIARLAMVYDYEYAGWFEALTGEVEEGLRPVVATMIEGNEDLTDYISYPDEINIGKPNLYLMGRGDKRAASNVVKTYPFPPLPNIEGVDLHKLMKSLLKAIMNNRGIDTFGI